MLKSVRIILAITAYFNHEIWQLDVKTKFLNGKLTKDVCKIQPSVLSIQRMLERVCKLQRPIHGLKQASQSWNLHFDEIVKRVWFHQER